MTSSGIAPTSWARVQRVLFAPPSEMTASGLYIRVDDQEVVPERISLRLPPGASVSLATYFGAFPLGYWSVWAGVERVRFTVAVQGRAEIILVASDARGAVRDVARVDAVDEVVSLDHASGRVDGGWVWARIRALGGGAAISDAGWEIPAERAPSSTATIAITTYNRSADCVALLRTLAGDDDLRSRVDRIIVVDQGSEKIRAAAGFDAAQSLLDGLLDVIEQPNLGGSGGFSRGMLTAAEGPSSHILLLDDDVVLEPESVLRMLSFADHVDAPVLVGAQMLSLTEPSVLHSWGERVDDDAFWWVPVDATLAPIDVVESRLEATPALHRVRAVDFNGWWMCLIPTSTVRRIGAALPLFIKWDDAEYGLRADAAGSPTVTLPGAALWHMPWTAKDDGLDWQAYFQLRNRLVTALLHSPHRRGGRVLSTSLAQDINHVLCMQYGSAALRRLALRDVLAGPDHLPPSLRTRARDARAILARAGQVVVADQDLPVARRSGAAGRPASLGPVLRASVTAVSRQLRRSPRPEAVPDIAVPRELGKWWVLSGVDSAVVGSATGAGAFVARRHRRTAISLLRDAVVLRATLWRRWPRLASSYRAESHRLASRTSWRRISEDDSF